MSRLPLKGLSKAGEFWRQTYRSGHFKEAYENLGEEDLKKLQEENPTLAELILSLAAQAGLGSDQKIT